MMFRSSSPKRPGTKEKNKEENLGANCPLYVNEQIRRDTVFFKDLINSSLYPVCTVKQRLDDEEVKKKLPEMLPYIPKILRDIIFDYCKSSLHEIRPKR